MRVAQLAELAGTTVRAIRHYHEQGLLPVPDERGGWRDYDLSHVARVNRIRWLADAGLSLATIKDVLDIDGVGARADLEAVRDGITEQIETLLTRRERLDRLIDLVGEAPGDGGTRVTPLPPTVDRFYARLEDAAPDEATRSAVLRERSFAEVAYCRGVLAPEFELLFAALDADELEASLAAYRDQTRPAGDDDVRRRADAAVARIEQKLAPHLPDLLERIDVEMVLRMYDLYLRTASDEERATGMAIRDRLLARLQELQEQR